MTENEAKYYLNDINVGLYYKSEKSKAIGVAIQALEEIQQYRAIGTIEEFKALKEKNESKKPYFVQYDANPINGNWHCPKCGGFVLYTHPTCSCGQALDW